MTAQAIGESIEYPAFGPLERMRLLRLCAQLTGDGDVAEDITQDTLIRAWRHAHQLRDPARRTQWLFAIARKECLRWAAGAGREGRRGVRHQSDEQTCEPHSIDQVAAKCDLEVDLERDDLAALLDRALALLPSMTRRVLLEKYIQESPQSEIAARLGVSEGTVLST